MTATHLMPDDDFSCEPPCEHRAALGYEYGLCVACDAPDETLRSKGFVLPSTFRAASERRQDG